MKITILTVGKIKERYFTDAISEYAKRLSKYCTLQMKEFPDEKTKENASEAEKEQVLTKEAMPILRFLEEHDGYVIALAIEGQKLSSEGLSKKMSDLMISGKSHFILIIGGSLGLSKDVLRKSDELLSFSDMTFPHQLMRVLLLEQLYRGFRILNHEPYHK